MAVRNFIHKRDLLLNLIQRDIKLHYKRSIVGIVWSLINPLFSLIIFSFVFQKIVPLNIPNYSSYVFTGLLAWTWFSASLNESNYSLLQSRDLVRKPNFQTEMIIAVSVASKLVNYLLALPILFGLLLFNGLIPNWTILFFPIIIAIQYLFTLGLAFIISATNVFFRDVMHITGLLVSVWFYLTPVFYSAHGETSYTWVIKLNPFTHILEMYRQILISGRSPSLLTLSISLFLALLIFVAGYILFRHLKYDFVDEL